MKFKFRYESLLSYRQHLKEKAAIEFARAQGILRKIDENIVAYKNEITKENDDLGKKMLETVSSNDIINHSEFIDALLVRIEIKKIERLKAEQVLSQKKEKPA